MNSKSPKALTNRQTISKLLDKLAEAEQPLPRFLEFYQKIITAQYQIKPPELSPTAAAMRNKAEQQLVQGKPLLTFRDLAIDWANVQDLFLEITKLTDEYLSPEPEETEDLKEIGTNTTSLKKVARTWFGIGTVSRSNARKGKELKPLTSSVLQGALHPFLAAHADELLPLVNQDSWHRGYCPVCGGNPDFASLDKEQGARWLMCFRCNAQWIFNRLACPYCGNQEQKTMGYFTDDEALYRLYFCEKCHHYIKTIDLRKTESDILLPFERVLTINMDRQASELNYKATE